MCMQRDSKFWMIVASACLAAAKEAACWLRGSVFRRGRRHVGGPGFAGAGTDLLASGSAGSAAASGEAVGAAWAP